MTLREWIELQAVIMSLWPHAPRLTEEQLRTQHRLVASVGAQAAVDAIEAWALAANAFPPPPGVVVAEVARRGEPTTGWAQARQLLVRAAAAFGRDREADALRWLAERSPFAARMAVEQGWRQWCREELDSPDHGGAVDARLARTYGGVVAGLHRERAEGRVRPLVGDRLRALGAGEGTPGQPRRLDVAGVLGVGEPR